MAHPVEDSFYPEYIESRFDDPRIPTPPPPTFETSIIASTQLQHLPRSTTDISTNVTTKQGRADVDLTQAALTDLTSSLIRNPAEKKAPNLIVDRNTFSSALHKPTIPVTNLDDNIEPVPHTLMSYNGRDTFPTSSHLANSGKRQGFFNDRIAPSFEPVQYEKVPYDGPFGLTREIACIYYLILAVLGILAAIFLILTGVFYGQNYPDSSNKTGKIAGMIVCAGIFYLCVELILIGIWHQSYRYESRIEKAMNPIVEESIFESKKSPVPENIPRTEHEQQEPPIDYAPSYVTTINEQTLLQQPGAATGTGFYETVVWPSNVQIETEADMKFHPIIEKPPLSMSPAPDRDHASWLDMLPAPVSKTPRRPEKTVVAVIPKTEFDNFEPNATMTASSVPNLPKAPETNDLIKTIAELELRTQKKAMSAKLSPKKSIQMQPADNKSSVSAPNGDDHDKNDKDRRHRHRHSHRRHHHDHHHSHRRHHHSHHHRRNHHHRRHSRSTSSGSSDDSSDFVHPRNFYPYQHYHHRSNVVALPKIITPRPPKVITPTPAKTTTAIYRDAAINTGIETKIMRDTSVTADFEEPSDNVDNRLDRIPVIRRTVIVEPYPAEPSSQIIVKSKANMIGKIRLGKQTDADTGETIIYPTTAFAPKKGKSKTKKKSTVVNNNVIEDLKLDDLYDDYAHKKTKKEKGKVHIRNAFYN